mgnify:CR=1 FL=1
MLTVGDAKGMQELQVKTYASFEMTEASGRESNLQTDNTSKLLK